MKSRKTILVFGLIALFLMSNSASALGISDIQISPMTVWLKDSGEVRISYTCSGCERSEIKIVGPATNRLDDADLKAGTTDFYQYNYVVDKPGTYEVTLTGYSHNDTNTTMQTTSFTAYDLNAAIVSPSASHPILKYRGDIFSDVYFDFSLVGDAEQIITESDIRKVNFEMYLNDIKLDLQYGDVRFDTDIGHWKFTPKVPDDIAPGLYDLIIKAHYEDQVVELSHADSVIIKPSLEAKIIEPTKNKFIALSGTDRINVKVEVTYMGQPIVLGEPTFRFYVGDEQLSVLSTQDEDDKKIWNLQTIVPGKDAGTEDITMYVEYNGETPYPSTLNEPDALHFVIPFEGKIVDSSGTVRPMTMSLENNDSSSYYSIKTGLGGIYKANIIPGKYDVNIELPGIVAKFKKVEITENTLEETSQTGGPINYDAPQNVGDIGGGIKIVKIIVLEFDLPFDDVELKITYDDSKIKNEENLEIFACNNWNFGKADCVSEWKEVDGEINPRGNIVMINTSRIYTYAIGERKNLNIILDNNIGLGTYVAGETIEIKGQVVDDEQDAIEGVVVTADIIGYDEEPVSKETIISGSFKINLPLPTEPGLVPIELKAVHEPYKPAEKSFNIDTEVKKEISFVNVPDGEKVYVGQPLNIKFIVMNTGQVELNNIRLFISGLATEWYQLLPVSINTLAPGEQKEVEFNILVSETYCEKYECKNYYPVTIKAESEETKKEALMTITLRRENPEVKNNETNATAAGAGIGLEGLITGGFSASEDIEDIAMLAGIIIIIVLIVLTVRKKAMGGGGIYRRDPRNSSLLHFAKSNVKTRDADNMNLGGLLGRNSKKDNKK